MRAGLTLEKFALVLSGLDAGLPKARVLKQAGLNAQQWAREHEYWLTELASQIAQQQYWDYESMAQRFCEGRLAAERELQLVSAPEAPTELAWEARARAFSEFLLEKMPKNLAQPEFAALPPLPPPFGPPSGPETPAEIYPPLVSPDQAPREVAPPAWVTPAAPEVFSHPQPPSLVSSRVPPLPAVQASLPTGGPAPSLRSTVPPMPKVVATLPPEKPEPGSG